MTESATSFTPPHESILLYGIEPSLRGNLRDQLERIGFQVTGSVDDKYEALELVRIAQPDLLITELKNNTRTVEDLFHSSDAQESPPPQSSQEPGLLIDTSDPHMQGSLWKHCPAMTGLIDAILPIVQSSKTELLLLTQSVSVGSPEQRVIHRLHHDLGLAERLLQRSSWTTDWIGSSYTWITVAHLVDEVTTESSGTLLEHQAIEIHMAKQVPNLLGDHNLLKTAFIEVLRNALRYSGRTGIVTFTVCRVEDMLKHDRNLGGRGYILFQISDTGPGFAPQELPRLITPFNSTEEDRLGLGLSITMGIIHQHGGWLEIHSVQNGGAEVRIYLPCCS